MHEIISIYKVKFVFVFVFPEKYIFFPGEGLCGTY